MEHEEIEWTVDYFKGINERLKAVGMPQLIIDEEKKMVYKDILHQALGIGIELES